VENVKGGGETIRKPLRKGGGVDAGVQLPFKLQINLTSLANRKEKEEKATVGKEREAKKLATETGGRRKGPHRGSEKKPQDPSQRKQGTRDHLCEEQSKPEEKKRQDARYYASSLEGEGTYSQVTQRKYSDLNPRLSHPK